MASADCTITIKLDEEARELLERLRGEPGRIVELPGRQLSDQDCVQAVMRVAILQDGIRRAMGTLGGPGPAVVNQMAFELLEHTLQKANQVTPAENTAGDLISLARDVLDLWARYGPGWPSLDALADKARGILGKE